MRSPHAGLVVAASLIAGCASTPRPFVAEIQPAPTNQPAFERTFQDCADEVAAGRRSNFQTGGVEAGQAVGAGTAAAGAVVIGSGVAAGTWSGIATIGAGMGLIVLAPVAMFAVSGAVRANRERAIQDAMGACLQQNSYTVSRWRRITPSEAASGVPSTPTAPHVVQPANGPAPAPR